MATTQRSVRWRGREPETRTPAAAATSRRRALAVERRLLRLMLERLGGPPFSFRLWDGTTESGNGAPRATVAIADRGALFRLVLDPSFQFGELYSTGRIEVEGDLLDFMEMVSRGDSPPGRLRRLGDWWTAAVSLTRARRNIHHHYDLGNDFYRLWLDEEMLYTCAYFESAAQSLEQAQLQKMDHVCRKLCLQPGERVVEAGSGWGALALHMARHYGVTVRSYNISHEQVAYARQRLREEGLEDRVEFVEDDYRAIARDGGRSYDAFVSVGMLEHVGRRCYAGLGAVMDRALAPHGRALIHTIGRTRPRPLNAWIKRRIFPGAYPPTLDEMMAIFAPYDFAVLDVENLRLHYEVTLRHWYERFRRAEPTVRERFGEPFVRAWRLYLAGSAGAFAGGSLHLFQVLVNRSGWNRLPWTRAHVYAPSSAIAPESSACGAATS